MLPALSWALVAERGAMLKAFFTETGAASRILCFVVMSGFYALRWLCVLIIVVCTALALLVFTSKAVFMAIFAWVSITPIAHANTLLHAAALSGLSRLAKLSMILGLINQLHKVLSTASVSRPFTNSNP